MSNKNQQQTQNLSATAPHRDNVTSQQVDTLLSIAGLMGNMLVNPHREFETGMMPKLDGGPHMAAATTFINVCAKLDEIVADKSRFGFEAQTHLEAQLFQLYKQNTLLLKEQTEATREVNRPHFRYRPSIAKLTDGNWCVMLGSLEDLDNAIVGVGVTPQAAVEAFDGMFVGEIPPALAKYLADREKALETQTQIPEYPKDIHELDSKGTETPSKPARRRKNRKTNR